jgi:type II secretory pathway pseudopilin PulG
MQILVHSKGVEKGPFSLQQVKQLLDSGQLSPTDLAWTEGMPEWKALSSFPELQPTSSPPPLSAATPPPIPTKKTEPLAVWSLTLGIISLIGCSIGGFLAAIPGVICGHIGMSRIKRNPLLRGNGMAVAGLVTGYVSIAGLPILAALALPAITGALERGQATQMLSNCRQIHLAVQTAQLEGISTGNPKLGFPADAKITSKAALKEILVANDYLTTDDFDRLKFQDIMVANVADEDPADTVFLKAFSPGKRFTIIVRKGGDGGIYRAGQDTQSADPPRTPAFLD